MEFLDSAILNIDLGLIWLKSTLAVLRRLLLLIIAFWGYGDADWELVHIGNGCSLGYSIGLGDGGS